MATGTLRFPNGERRDIDHKDLGKPLPSGRIMTVVNWGKEKLNVWPRDKHGQLIMEK